MKAICDGNKVVFLVSDTADISEWPLVKDGAKTFMSGLDFIPTLFSGVNPTVPIEYLSVKNGVVIEDTVRYNADIALASKVSVPLQVSMTQARLALLQYGLLANVDTAIAAMLEPAKSEAKIMWEYSTVLRRNNPLVQNITMALGLTSAQVNDLFVLASTFK